MVFSFGTLQRVGLDGVPMQVEARAGCTAYDEVEQWSDTRPKCMSSTIMILVEYNRRTLHVSTSPYTHMDYNPSMHIQFTQATQAQYFNNGTSRRIITHLTIPPHSPASPILPMHRRTYPPALDSQRTQPNPNSLPSRTLSPPSPPTPRLYPNFTTPNIHPL